jgi:hypothetical protein
VALPLPAAGAMWQVEVPIMRKGSGHPDEVGPPTTGPTSKYASMLTILVEVRHAMIERP